MDDATWADLDLDELFSQLDRTLTEPGQQALHAWLRTPTEDLLQLRRRSDAIGALERSAPLREDLQLRLAPLADAPQGVFAQLLGAAVPSLPLPRFAYQVLAVGSLASLAAFGWRAGLGVLLVGLAYVLATLAHYSALRRVTACLPGLVAIQELFGAAQRLVATPMPGLGDEQAGLRAQLGQLFELSAAVSSIGGPHLVDETIGEYVDIFTLRQERLFCRAAPLLTLHAQALGNLALRVGEMDALQALASWRSGRSWCAPELVASSTLTARGLRHPLIEKCVPNDLRLSPAVLVTGSNMSGKSTYLRSVALNALLAQVAHTCLWTRSFAAPTRSSGWRRPRPCLDGWQRKARSY